MLKPTRKQIKTWLSMVADHGCVITGSSQIHIHHAVGQKYVKDGYQIGELFAYGLWKPLHMNSLYDLTVEHYGWPKYNITDHRKAFLKEHGFEWERDIVKKMVDEMLDKGLVIPFDQIYLDKIQLVPR